MDPSFSEHFLNLYLLKGLISGILWTDIQGGFTSLSDLLQLVSLTLSTVTPRMEDMEKHEGCHN